MRRSLLIGLLGALAVSACSPVPMLQTARLAKDGQTKVAVGGAAFVPVESTYFEPDGPTEAPKHDLRYIPLPHAIGWVRHGVGVAEIQAGFHLPSFLITVGCKIGLFGNDRDAAFGMALVADVGATPILMDLAYGATFVTTIAPWEDLTLDLSARFGSMPGLWSTPALTAVASLGIALGEKDWLRIGGAYTVDVLGGAADGATLVAVWEY